MLPANSCKIFYVAAKFFQDFVYNMNLPRKVLEFSMFSKKCVCMHGCNMQVFFPQVQLGKNLRIYYFLPIEQCASASVFSIQFCDQTEKKIQFFSCNSGWGPRADQR